MKKFFKLGKRMMALFIVVLLNINSYAAVGANDGSAFVTKAEFDALVNTFNEQMDIYQSGLNAKIDGAIASYLGGLSSESSIKQDNLYTIGCDKTGIDKLCFMKKIDGIEYSEATGVSYNGEILAASVKSGGTSDRARFWSQRADSGKALEYNYRINDYGFIEKFCGTRVNHYVAGSVSNSTSSAFPINGVNVTGGKETVGSFTSSIGTGVGAMAVICTIDREDVEDSEYIDYEENKVFAIVDATTDVYVTYQKEIEKIESLKTMQWPMQNGATSEAYRDWTLWTSGTGAWTGTGPSVEVYGIYKHKVKLADTVMNGVAKTALGEDVMSYEGTPVTKVTEDGTLRFAMTWNATVSGEDYVRLGLKINSRFNNSDDVSIEGVETNLPNNLARINETITVEVKNMKKNDVLWLKGVPVASDYAYLTIENVELVRNN